MNYYNDIETAGWLRNLIDAGLIPPGEVDERSIIDVRPGDLRGFTQCHFFAGIGGWSEALRLAGWPTDRPVWTGSCPCQPFSTAGKRKSLEDERHLWPEFYRLIRQCRPEYVFGEQVSGKPGLQWLDVVQDDLESSGYAIGSVTFPAGSVGAYHQRQRLYWVAKPTGERRHGERVLLQPGRQEQAGAEVAGGGDTAVQVGGGLSSGHLANAPPAGLQDDGRPEEHRGAGSEQQQDGRRRGAPGGASAGFWDDIECRPFKDGKWRPVKPGIEVLAHGVQGRVAQLRGIGNAIVPQQAALFIEAASLPR